MKDNDLSFLEGVRRGAFTVPGDGCIDFDPIFKVLEENGYEGYMLVEAEQDPAKANPLEYAIKARKFIREKTRIINQEKEGILWGSTLITISRQHGSGGTKVSTDFGQRN